MSGAPAISARVMIDWRSVAMNTMSGWADLPGPALAEDHVHRCVKNLAQTAGSDVLEKQETEVPRDPLVVGRRGGNRVQLSLQQLKAPFHRLRQTLVVLVGIRRAGPDGSHRDQPLGRAFRSVARAGIAPAGSAEAQRARTSRGRVGEGGGDDPYGTKRLAPVNAR